MAQISCYFGHGVLLPLTGFSDTIVKPNLFQLFFICYLMRFVPYYDFFFNNNFKQYTRYLMGQKYNYYQISKRLLVIRKLQPWLPLTTNISTDDAL
jgi:hypothetical protein